jgi:hypothetical protein
MIGDLERATFSNIEHQGIEFAVHSIRPWAVRWEQILNHDLFTARERDTYFCEFNLEGLLRGDSTQRAQFYKELFAVGALSVNDVREKENLNPVEGGDQRFIPLNVVPLDMAREAVMRKTPTTPAPDSPKRSAPAIAADAVMPACLEVTERMLRRELTQVRRAARRAPAEFPAWVDEFYGQQRDAIAQAYAPVVESLARLFLPASRAVGFARAWSDECALRQVQHAREDLSSIAAVMPAEFELRVLDLAQRWEGERALMLAAADARRLAEALQQEGTEGAPAASPEARGGASQHTLDLLAEMRHTLHVASTRESPPAPAPVVTVHTPPVHVEVVMPKPVEGRTITTWERDERNQVVRTVSHKED